MTTLDAHQAKLQVATLDVLAYAAAMSYPLTSAEIMHYLPVSTLQLSFEQALEQLVSDKKVARISDYYGLPKINYPNPHNTRLHQAQLLAKAQRVAKALAVLPFVRAIAVVHSVGFGNVQVGSDINLLIITKPHRLYLAKALVYCTLKLSRQKESANARAGRCSAGLFISTNGINWRRDMMSQPEPHLAYWLISARPLYGADTWYGLLRQQPWLLTRFPNWPWPKTRIKLPSLGWRALDTLDEVGYKYHLRHVAEQPIYKQAGAFLRLRPDVICQNPLDRSADITDAYHKIKAKSTTH